MTTRGYAAKFDNLEEPKLNANKMEITFQHSLTNKAQAVYKYYISKNDLFTSNHQKNSIWEVQWGKIKDKFTPDMVIDRLNYNKEIPMSITIYLRLNEGMHKDYNQFAEAVRDICISLSACYNIYTGQQVDTEDFVIMVGLKESQETVTVERIKKVVAECFYNVESICKGEKLKSKFASFINNVIFCGEYHLATSDSYGILQKYLSNKYTIQTMVHQHLLQNTQKRKFIPRFWTSFHDIVHKAKVDLQESYDFCKILSTGLNTSVYNFLKKILSCDITVNTILEFMYEEDELVGVTDLIILISAQYLHEDYINIHKICTQCLKDNPLLLHVSLYQSYHQSPEAFVRKINSLNTDYNYNTCAEIQNEIDEKLIQLKQNIVTTLNDFQCAFINVKHDAKDMWNKSKSADINRDCYTFEEVYKYYNIFENMFNLSKKTRTQELISKMKSDKYMLPVLNSLKKVNILNFTKSCRDEINTRVNDQIGIQLTDVQVYMYQIGLFDENSSSVSFTNLQEEFKQNKCINLLQLYENDLKENMDLQGTDFNETLHKIREILDCA
eukprot:341077_1